jgi:hypothetical protein
VDNKGGSRYFLACTEGRAQPPECGFLSFSSTIGCGCSELLGPPVTRKSVRPIYTDGPRHLIIGHGWRCRFHRTLKFAASGRATGRSRVKEREGSLWAQREGIKMCTPSPRCGSALLARCFHLWERTKARTHAPWAVSSQWLN